MADDALDQFIHKAALRFVEAKGQPESIRKVLIDYLRAGDAVGCSHAELIDFLGVSTPSVLDLAEYSDPEQESVMQLLATLE
jgi:hypothetical protein